MVRFFSAALIALTVSATAAAPAFAGQHHGGKGGHHLSGGHGKHSSFAGLGGMKGLSGVIGLLEVLGR